MRTLIAAAVLSVALVNAQQTQQTEPRITGVTPENPVVSQKPQTLTVTGEGFRPGLTLFLTTPGGDVKTFAGDQLQAQRATSFQISIALNDAGRYSLEVANEKGPRSTAFTFQAKPSGAGKEPFIDEIMPAEFSRSREPQLVRIAGRNFAPGLKLTLSDPKGDAISAEVTRVEAQMVSFSAVFSLAGLHEVMVINPSGERSNSVTMSVN
jgi:hypothetical protein